MTHSYQLILIVSFAYSYFFISLYLSLIMMKTLAEIFDVHVQENFNSKQPNKFFYNKFNNLL